MRLADPGLAFDDDDPAVAVGGHLCQGVAEQAQLFVAAHQRAGLGDAVRAPSGRLEHRHLADSLELDRRTRREADRHDGLRRRLVAPDLAGGGFGEPRREVDGGADQREFRARRRAAQAGEEPAAGHADRGRVRRLRERGVQGVGGADRALGVVAVAAAGDAPGGDDDQLALVVDEALDDTATKLVDAVLHQRDGALQRIELGRCPDFAEQHGGETQLGEPAARAGPEALDDVARHEGQDRRLVGLGRCRAALAGQRRRDLVDREPAARLDAAVAIAFEQGEGLRRKHDLARRRGGGARHLSQRVAAEQRFPAALRSAQDRGEQIAGADADAQAERHVRRPLELGNEDAQAQRGRGRGEHGRTRIARREPAGDRRVAGELVDLAAALLDDRDDPLETAVQDRLHLLDAGLAVAGLALGQRREAGDVGDQQGAAQARRQVGNERSSPGGAAAGELRHVGVETAHRAARDGAGARIRGCANLLRPAPSADRIHSIPSPISWASNRTGRAGRTGAFGSAERVR